MRRADTGSRAHARRQEIVDAGYRAMLRTSLATVRTRDIAAEAGITVATLHYYFPTKNELVRAVTEYAISEQLAWPFAGEIGVPSDGLAWLRAMLEGLRLEAERDCERFRLLHEIVWFARADPELHALLARWHTAWHANVVESLEAGRRTGSVRADLDPTLTATAVVYLVLGITLRLPGLAEEDAGLPAEVDRILRSIKQR